MQVALFPWILLKSSLVFTADNISWWKTITGKCKFDRFSNIIVYMHLYWLHNNSIKIKSVFCCAVGRTALVINTL